MYGLSGPKNVFNERAPSSFASVSSSPQYEATLLPQNSLMVAPTGVTCLTRSRYLLTCSARMVVAKVADDRTPIPFSAATSKLSVWVQARYSFGWGSWSGFGRTRRG